MSLDEIESKDISTPMMQHWLSIKKQYPDHLIAYRLGDFYEFFYSDAEKISKLLGLTLTKRKIGNDSYPLAGIPHHAGTYLTNLVNMGQTIVVVEQLEDPATVKGRIVKRGIVRILSPGTVIESDMLKSSDNNYIASMVKEKKGYGVAFADLSTGEFVTTEFLFLDKDPMEKLLNIFSQYDPVELIVPLEFKKDERLFILLTDITEAIIKTYNDFAFKYSEAYDLIKSHFKLANLVGFGLENLELGVQAAGGLLAFLKETQRDVIPNIFKISVIREEGVLKLDYVTQRNLELIDSLWEKGKDTTLYSVFNKTCTPMGARLLKKTILQPLTNAEEINQRLNIVQKFREDVFLREELREHLNLLGDLERYINRVNFSGRTNARDLLNIKNSIEGLPKIKVSLEKAKVPEISKFLARIKGFEEVRTLIASSIKEDAPTTIKDGNIIKDNFNGKVDELRDILHNGKKYILDYEEQQKKKLGIATGLKISHNSVLGYFIQITTNALKSVSKLPEEYIERATITNGKRFTTVKLKDFEDKVVDAEEKINDLEYEIFNEIREKVAEQTSEILETTRNVAIIDVLACFAEISEKFDYCRPQITVEPTILIKEGRHPVVEQINISEKFIPNDCFLDVEKEQILIITGPNMAGKSTYLRQVALICLIAQMGCFVPAKSASIGILDQIFTRIGASDDLARRLSTFMIEMTETAKILNNATPKSLVIIDELGRGTSTSDGQSIAMATLEKLHELKAKTLFSTHYHQLTEINLPRVSNYHLDIIENDDGTINFVRKLRSGSTDKSYGIHVAKLAGIPENVIVRAFEILDQIEKKDPFKAAVRENGNDSSAGKYQSKLVERKQKEIEKISQELALKKKELNKCEDLLEQKKRELETKGLEFEKNKKESESKEPEDLKPKSSPSVSKVKKQYVQTTFFKPIVKKEVVFDDQTKNLLNIIKSIDLNQLTPVEAMKKLIELKEKLDAIKS